MCLKLHIPRSPWQRSFAKLVKRAGENSTAHFWVYGYYFACAAELIECDFGHPWSKGKRLRRLEALHQSSRDGYHFGYSPPSALLADSWKDESQGDRDKEERNKLSRFWNEVFCSLLPCPFQCCWMGWFKLILQLFSDSETELYQSRTLTLVNNLLEELAKWKQPVQFNFLLKLPSMTSRHLSFLHNPWANKATPPLPLLEKMLRLTFSLLVCEHDNVRTSPAQIRNHHSKTSDPGLVVLYLL